jgi:hypothetical protein
MNLTEVQNESMWYELQTLTRSVNSITNRSRSSRNLSNIDRRKRSLYERKTSDRLINQRRSTYC